MNYFWALIFTLFLSSCVVEKGDVKVNIKKNSKTSQISSANVSAISIVNNQVIVSGNNLSVVSGLKINGLAFNELFTIESKSANQIVANANRAFSFDVSKIFELVLSDAHGSAAFPISFDLPNASVTAPKLNPMGALTGQVLKYDGAEWVASTLSNSQIYLGTYDATLNVPNLNITSPISGDYYIVTTAGTFNAINYEVGDWIMHNGSAWEKISNSSNVVSSFNGRRGIVVPANGDYSWTMLTTASGKLTGSTLGSIADIDLTGIANNKVLKWDATNLKWIMGDDLSGGGAGTVTSTEISDDSITNADINSAAAIAYSKLNVPAGAIAYAKLSVADNEIPAIKVNGLSSAISGLLTATVADADTTHAPTSDAVFDALGLKLNLAGGTLTPGGTIAGLPALPLAGSEATSKDYVDAQITTVSTSANGKVSKIGDTMTGVLTLDSDLKMKGVSNYVSLKANGAMAADYNFTLPVSGGTAGYVLATDGTGGTSWINPAVNSTSITDGSIVNADVAAAANIDAAKLATGVVDNTEFNYLNGVTSAIQTQLDNKQALDATLTSLSGFNTNGIMVQTAADTFVGRTIAGTANRLIVTDGNGVAGNPTIDIPTALLPSPLVGNVGSFLKATAADTALWSALTALDVTTALTYTPVNKAGDTLSTGTLTINGTAHISLPAPTLLTDPTTKDYVDTQIAGASNQWGQSAGNVYRSSGNVGIGTTTPASMLHISGDAGGATIQRANSSGPDYAATLAFLSSRGTTGATTASLLSDFTGKISFGGHDGSAYTNGSRIIGKVDITPSAGNVPNALVFETGANTAGLAERMRISSTGNIGIGTTTPNSTLQVNGSGIIVDSGTNASYGSGIKLMNTTNKHFTAGMKGSNFVISDTSISGVSTWSATPLDRFSIDSNGNVGIGTTAPTQKLQVENSSGSAIALIKSSNDSGMYLDSATGRFSHNRFLENGVGKFEIGYSPTANGLYFNPNTAVAETGAAMVIKNTGYVGIGNPTPAYNLDVAITETGGINIKDNSSTGGRAYIGEGTSSANLFSPTFLGTSVGVNRSTQFMGEAKVAEDTGTTPVMIFVSRRDDSAALSTRPLFEWRNASSSLMTMSANGYLGIGTSSPAQKLNITGASVSGGAAQTNISAYAGSGLRLDGSISNTSQDAITYQSGGGGGAAIAFRRGGAYETYMDFYTNGAATPGAITQAMTIDNAGKVGIGTTGPSSKLNIVDGTSDIKMGLNLTSNGGPSLILASSANVYSDIMFNTLSTGQVRLRGSSYGLAIGGTNPRLNIGYADANYTTAALAVNGNVGVGTTTPSYTLHVVGTAGLSTGTAWTNASDLRLKDIHGDYEYGLDEILKLHTVRYSYKKDNPLGLPSDFAKTGFIAQEVQKIIPDAVKKREDGFLELNVDPIHWAVVNSIKDLYRKYILPLWENDKLQDRAIASLRKEKDADIAKKDKEIAELKARLERIEKRLMAAPAP